MNTLTRSSRLAALLATAGLLAGCGLETSYALPFTVTPGSIRPVPELSGVDIAVGIKVVPGVDVPKVREAVKRELFEFLSPLHVDRGDGERAYDAWPLRKSVVDRELMAVASRVDGVMLVTNVLLAYGTRDPAPEIPMRGLQLPRVMGISVVEGDPIDLALLRGAATPDAPAVNLVPVPFIPKTC